MLSEVLTTIATIAIMLVSIVAQPTRANCPAGWYAEGVRPSGSFVCHEGNGVPVPPGRIGMRVYCTGGAVPVLRNDGATVGCMRVP